ncbi:carcinoembryonic antigen-related cell adhesion molecule 1 [Plakobranchus ocellatus]|uniref:Carcinoembryonic antigen-related cell adhesion molecule 1 n=1 Tax=Plakobranchus ocellatus TaxID=259542 RepID=A0AAV4DNG4_9GAST|nr:carcinoembryonic antigen-related cell adhesion molecule 1 [Plakobranchus ocellatus]
MMFKILFCALIAIAIVPIKSQSFDGVSLRTEPRDRKLLVLAGEEQKLVCEATFPQKNDTVVWQLPHQEVKNIKQRISDAGLVDGQYKKTVVLTLHNFSAAYAGKYSCAYIPVGGSSPTHTSTIELVSVSVQRSNFAYDDGNETVTLYCAVDIEDAKFSQWLKNNKTLENGDKYEILEGNHSLVIKTLDRDDAGAYVARYNVHYKSLDCVVHYTAGPLVLDMGESIDATVGDTVNIDCDVKGWPTPEVEWWFNDEKKPEALFVVSFEEYKGVKGARLVLTGVTIDYNGMYTCRAYSAQFNETSDRSIRLRVVGQSTNDTLGFVWTLYVILAFLLLGIIILIAICLYLKSLGEMIARHVTYLHQNIAYLN